MQRIAISEDSEHAQSGWAKSCNDYLNWEVEAQAWIEQTAKKLVCPLSLSLPLSSTQSFLYHMVLLLEQFMANSETELVDGSITF